MTKMNEKVTFDLHDLLYLMARLRNPETGCPWDIKQDFQSIVPHTLEEVYEVIDTIERGDFSHLREELGDLVFQAIFYSQMALEQGLFSFADVIHELTAKLIERHPHVFPKGTLDSERDRGPRSDEGAIKKTWESLKAQRRLARGEVGRLADIPSALPALSRAQKLQKRAANYGFDWPDYRGVLDKIDEELAELREAITLQDRHHIEEELGDLIFACSNLGRHMGFDVESCLRRASTKFQTRFRAMEVLAENNNSDFEQLSVTAKNALWQQVKTEENNSAGPL